MAELDYQLIRSKRRTLALEINANAQLIVRSPEKLAIKVIERFIADKEYWIINKQKLAKTSSDTERKHYTEGEKHLYLGNQYAIKYAEQQQALLFFQDIFYLNPMYQSQAADIFKAWYKQQAKTYLPQRLAYLANKHQLRYQNVKISKALSRWGSCSSKNNINLNYRLMLTPTHIVDYIVIHELAHIRFKNHSKDFWAFVAQMMPDYQQAENWLKANGRAIMQL